MNLVLDATDLAKLSPNARAEIFRLLEFVNGTPTSGAVFEMTEAQPQRASPIYSDMDERGLINLTPTLAAQLIRGVNSKSKALLHRFAESPDAELELLFPHVGTPHEPRYKDFAAFKREFIGPVNRRLRNITNNRLAELFYIYMTDDLETGEHEESFVYVSKQTAESLKNVLKRVVGLERSGALEPDQIDAKTAIE